MPDFSSGALGYRHTVDSALQTLESLGVPPSRITIAMAGLGAPDRQVVSQSPKPGEPLDGGSAIRLSVAGLGFFEHLPVGMWHRGGEEGPGVEEMVRVFDDPLQKALCWMREGARLFDIRSGDPAACERWIRLFGLNPAEWPRENWPTLARLLPSLRKLAGSEDGVRTALRVLLGLPLMEIRRRPCFRRLSEREISRLGGARARLGVDMVAGDRLEDLAELRLRLGPVDLETYRDYEQPHRRRLVEQTVALVAFCYQDWSLDWVVLGPDRELRSGARPAISRLGLNAYLAPKTEKIHGNQ